MSRPRFPGAPGSGEPPGNYPPPAGYPPPGSYPPAPGYPPGDFPQGSGQYPGQAPGFPHGGFPQGGSPQGGTPPGNYPGYGPGWGQPAGWGGGYGGYGAPPGGAPPGWGPGAGGPGAGRASSRVLIGAFGLALVAVLAVVAVVVFAGTPAPPPPQCEPGKPCGGPPIVDEPRATPGTGPVATPGGGATSPPTGPGATPAPTPVSNSPALTLGAVWRSSELGYEFEYDPKRWTIAEEGPRRVRLTAFKGAAIVLVEGVPAGESTPQAAIQRRVDALSQNIIGLAVDERPFNALFGPAIGYLDGVGNPYAGTVDTPQGPSEPVGVVVTSATDGKLTVTITVIALSSDLDDQHRIRRRADSLLKTFRWEPRP